MNKLIDYLRECFEIVPEVNETETGWSEKPSTGIYTGSFFANSYNKLRRLRSTNWGGENVD